MANSIKVSIFKVAGSYTAFKNLYRISSLENAESPDYTIGIQNDVIYYCFERKWKPFITIKPASSKFFFNEGSKLSTVLSEISKKYNITSINAPVGTISFNNDSILILLEENSTKVWKTVLRYSSAEFTPAPSEEENPSNPNDNEDYQGTRVTREEIIRIIKEYIGYNSENENPIFLLLNEKTNLIGLENNLQNIINDINAIFIFNGSSPSGSSSSNLPTSITGFEKGYYDSENNAFYRDEEKTNLIEPIADKIYLDLTSNLIYRWSTSENIYIEISKSLSLGDSSTTAFAGDRGAAIEASLSDHINSSSLHTNLSASDKETILQMSELYNKPDTVINTIENHEVVFDASTTNFLTINPPNNAHFNIILNNIPKYFSVFVRVNCPDTQYAINGEEADNYSINANSADFTNALYRISKVGNEIHVELLEFETLN